MATSSPYAYVLLINVTVTIACDSTPCYPSWAQESRLVSQAFLTSWSNVLNVSTSPVPVVTASASTTFRVQLLMGADSPTVALAGPAAAAALALDSMLSGYSARLGAPAVLACECYIARCESRGASMTCTAAPPFPPVARLASPPPPTPSSALLVSMPRAAGRTATGSALIAGALLSCAIACCWGFFIVTNKKAGQRAANVGSARAIPRRKQLTL